MFFGRSQPRHVGFPTSLANNKPIIIYIFKMYTCVFNPTQPPNSTQPNGDVTSTTCRTQDLLWSDPMDQLGRLPSPRGGGVLFGPDVTERAVVNEWLRVISTKEGASFRGRFFFGGEGGKMCKKPSGWWFQMFFIFTPTWGNDPI